MSDSDFHIVIIGAGVVGLAIAERLSRRFSSIVVLERNESYGMETSSRNSEVIHAGIYYEQNSLKAQLCVRGRDSLYEICHKNNIPHRKISKVIVAQNDSELAKLEILYHNGLTNHVPLEWMDRKAIITMEPHVLAVAALYSPLTGIISAHSLMDFFYHSAIEHGVIVQRRCEVVGIEKENIGYSILLEESGNQSRIRAEIVINAAGLGSDSICEMLKMDPDILGYRLHYCKGSYFSVVPDKWGLVSRLVYPVPQTESLGVHALVDLGGRLKFGPDVEYLENRILHYQVDESKKGSFGIAIRKLLPEIGDEDIVPDMSGIRPKLQKQGAAAQDFMIRHEKDRGFPGFINLIGIDSPGLTASPAIAEFVDQML